jgi:predicted HAD superfamily Cof-like phosphohydrolase
MTNFGDVGQFNHKFGLPSVIHDGGPKLADLADPEVQERLELKYTHLSEELQEFWQGWSQDDVEQMADALVDLVYVAMGAAHFLGLPWELLWQEVHRANMRKVRATSADESKRDSVHDVVKPEGWIGPDLASILQHFGLEED